MKKRWIVMLLVAVIAAGMMAGCQKKEETKLVDEKNICGKVQAVREGNLVLSVGEIEDFLNFSPNGEEMTIKLSDQTKIERMVGIRKSTAAVKDLNVGDILAVTIKVDGRVEIVIQPKESVEETS